MPTVTMKHLRSARKKRAEQRRKMVIGAALLFGTSLILLVTVLAFINREKADNPYKDLRCVQLKENSEGFEECVKWEREKTIRSRIVVQPKKGQSE